MEAVQFASALGQGAALGMNLARPGAPRLRFRPSSGVQPLTKDAFQSLDTAVPAVLAALPEAACTDDCDKHLQAYAEYALMYPYLTEENKENLKGVGGIVDLKFQSEEGRECDLLEHPVEIWFIRHSFSCNNKISKSNPFKFVASTKYDPGLTTQGIVDALLFNHTNTRLHEIESDGPLKVFVSTSIRTWQTATLLYAKYRPVNLYVVPGLTEKHGSEISYGNVPAPLQQQGQVMRVFIEQVYLQYGIHLHSVVVYAYNNPDPLMTFYQPADLPAVPDVGLERVSTRYEKTNKTAPVCSIDQCNVHPLNPVEDPEVKPQTTWPRVFSMYYKEKPLFAALDRIMFTNLYNTRDGKRVYLCTTHSRAMQTALTGGVSLLANHVLRDFLNRDAVRERVFASARKGLKQVQCPLPLDETPQFVSSSHNMWQLKCEGSFGGSRRGPLLCLTNVTMFQGFRKFTTGLETLDSNHSCENDVEGLPVVARKAIGLAAHPNSRMYNAIMVDPSKGQAERALAAVNKLEKEWYTRNKGVMAALRRTRRRGG